MFFVITSVDRYNVKYAIQDEEEHRTKELIVPPHAEVYLHIVFKNRLRFIQTYFTFYFDGDRTKNPIIREWFSPFVKEGENRKSPSTHKSHYIDYHGAYHIDETRHRAKGDWVVYSFNITTRDVGTYKTTVEIAADGVSSTLSLALRVEDKPINKMRCVAHWGCFVAANPPAWRGGEARG